MLRTKLFMDERVKPPTGIAKKHMVRVDGTGGDGASVGTAVKN